MTVIHPPSRRGAAAGLAMNGVALGVVVGPLVGGGLYSLAGRVGPFYPVLALLAVSAFAQVGLAFGERRIGELAGMGGSIHVGAGCSHRSVLFCRFAVIQAGEQKVWPAMSSLY